MGGWVDEGMGQLRIGDWDVEFERISGGLTADCIHPDL